MEDQLTKPKLTESQQAMVDAGYPASLFWTPEQRKQAWEDNPPKPLPAFNSIPKNATDQETLKLLAEIETEKKKSKTKSQKLPEVDRTGQRWNGVKGKWEVDDIAAKVEKAMISITTNTRGATKMSTKDYAEMTGPELVAAYNKISGKDPIKKFKDKATGLAAVAKIVSAKAAAKAVAASNGSKPKTKSDSPKAASENKRAAEFGCRVGSFREKLIIALDESYKKMVPELDLLKAVYGSKNTENSGALTMVIKGAQTMIDKNKLPYILKKEKDENKAVSHGLYPKA